MIALNRPTVLASQQLRNQRVSLVCTMRRLYFTVLNAKTRGFFHSLILFAAQQLWLSRLLRFNLLMGYFISFGNLRMYSNRRSLYEHTIFKRTAIDEHVYSIRAV